MLREPELSDSVASLTSLYFLRNRARRTCWLGRIVAVSLLCVFAGNGCKRSDAPTAEAAAKPLVESRAQPTAPQPTCIDLSKHYTASLTDSLNSPASVKENNFAALPAGRQVLGGVAFEIGGILQLSGEKLREWRRDEFPEEIKEIAIGKACGRLHLLHGAGGVYDGEGTAIARLVLHYADKSTHEFAIKVGHHVRDWWGDPKQPMIGTTSVLAWSGSNPALVKYSDGKGALRLYRSTFINPQPDVAITTVDYVSNMANSSPFLMGITIE